MGNTTFKSTQQLIPLPSTVVDIDPSSNSILSKLKQIPSNPFRIVSLQSLIESGLAIMKPIISFHGVYLYIMNFSPDLEYLPVGDIAVKKLNNNFNCSDINTGGGPAINNVYKRTNQQPWLNLQNATTTQSTTQTNSQGALFNTSNNAINYNISPNQVLSLSATTSSGDNWWQLNLNTMTSINMIEVFDRGDDQSSQSNLSNCILTISDNNNNIVYTYNFGIGIRSLYAITLNPSITGQIIKISKSGQLVLGKVIINRTVKHLGWYRDCGVNGTDCSQRAISSTYNTLTAPASWITCAFQSSFPNSNGIDTTISGTQNNNQCFLGDNNSTYNKFTSLSNHENCMFEDVPVLLVKNNNAYSSIIPNNSWNRVADGNNFPLNNPPTSVWNIYAVSNNSYNGNIVLGNIVSVRVGYQNSYTPQDLTSYPDSKYFKTRTYASVNSDYVVNRSLLYPSEYTKPSSPSNPTIRNYTYYVGEQNTSENVYYSNNYHPTDDHILLYSSPFGTFVDIFDSDVDPNTRSTSNWNQPWSFFDVRPESLKLFCCSSNNNITSILPNSDPVNHFDLATYCKNYNSGSSTCSDIINSQCDFNKLYYEYNSTDTFNPCKSFLLDNPGKYDTLAKSYALSNPLDPFSSCIVSKKFADGTSQIIQDMYNSNKQCMDPVCAQDGYKLQSQLNPCNVNLLQCIQNTPIYNNGVVTDNTLNIKPTTDCSQTVNNITNVQPTAVDCVVSWSDCNVPCGGGTQTGTITQQPQNGGVACPTVLTKSCNTDVCPSGTSIDCKVSEWSACSKTCGGGTQTRSILTPSIGLGKECPTDLAKSCNTQDCPTTPTSPDANLKLYIGLAIGGFFLLMIIMIVIILVMKR